MNHFVSLARVDSYLDLDLEILVHWSTVLVPVEYYRPDINHTSYSIPTAELGGTFDL